MSKNKGFSLDDLNSVKKQAIPFEFEYIDENDELSGVWFSVYGGESELVRAETGKLQNNRRRQDANREMRQQRKKVAEFTPFESDVEYGIKMASKRIAGWRKPGEVEGLTAEEVARFCGIDVDFNTENALIICQNSPEIASQITDASVNSANFT